MTLQLELRQPDSRVYSQLDWPTLKGWCQNKKVNNRNWTVENDVLPRHVMKPLPPLPSHQAFLNQEAYLKLTKKQLQEHWNKFTDAAKHLTKKTNSLEGSGPTSLYQFSHCWDEMLGKSNFWGKCLFGSGFENIVCQSVEGLLEGAGGSWSHWIYSQETESRAKLIFSLLFPFLYRLGPQPREWHGPHLGYIFLPQLTSPKYYLTHVPSGLTLRWFPTVICQTHFLIRRQNLLEHHHTTQN